MTMETIIQLGNIVVPVFICVGLGVLWARVGTPFDSKLITSLVYNIGAPCLILATFQKVTLSAAAMVEVALATLACYAAFTVIAFVLIKIMQLDLPSYLPSLIFPLTGSMGLPVSYYAFGEEGLALAIVYFTFGAIGTFTLGAAIAAGTISFKKLAKAPVIYAVAIAVTLQLYGTPLPEWIFNTTNLLGGMVIPAQLVALGVSLLELKTGVLRSSFLGLFRLAMGVGVGFLIADAFGLEERGPCHRHHPERYAGSCVELPVRPAIQTQAEEVAGMVVVSTAASFVTLPLLLLAVL